MAIYFTIYSFFGYFLESFYISLIERKWVSSGLLKGPFIPLYGFASLILILLSSYISPSFLSFFSCGIIMTLLEYITSLFIEKVFHQKCWDYSHLFCNYQGRICLFYFIIWCGLSYIFITWIHPFISSFIPLNDFSYLIAFICIVYLIKTFIDKLNQSQEKGLITKKEKKTISSI